MTDKMFRKVALDGLSSPEELDEAIRVASPRTWMALAAILALAVAALAWSVTARIPTTVAGTGVLIRAGGVYSVVASANGRVQQVLVADDASVKQDQPVAIIDQPELRARLRAEEQALGRERADLGALVDRRQRELRLGDEQRRRERMALDAEARQADADVTFLRGELASNRELESRGLVTHQSTIDIERRIQQATIQAATLRNQIQQSIDAGRIAADRHAEEMSAARARVTDRESQLALLGEQVDASTVVRSFYTGRVLAVKVDPGNLVGVGAPLLSLEIPANHLEAVVFVDAVRAKEIRPGMRVELAPSGVRREEYGFMVGEVTRVSAYPATMEEEMRLLENEPLVRAMQGDGADVQVTVRLQADPKTRSGFKWSSRTGPPVAIDSGTICKADVVTRSEAPIHLLFPAIKRTLGLY